MDSGIERVIKQFPGFAAQIRQLWAADEDFQGLCQDYVLCLSMLLPWSAGAMPIAQRGEYHSLCQKLAFEIEMKIHSVQLDHE